MKDDNQIRLFLINNADEKYKAFHSKLMPTILKNKILGVRTPVLRAYAKKLNDNSLIERFLNELPHEYYEENNLHAFLIERQKDYDKCLELTKKFLPYIDNWATCDSFFPPVFKKNPQKTREFALQCMQSDKVYTVRYGIGICMSMFLGEQVDMQLAEVISKIPATEYYVHMMVAWYFATALSKNYTLFIGYIENKILDEKTHNKAIQKAIESFRITPEQKEYLRTLKIR